MENNIKTLIEAISIAQKRGAFSLEEIDAILSAIKACLPKPEVKEDTPVEPSVEPVVE